MPDHNETGSDLCTCDGSGKLTYERVDRDAEDNVIGRTWGTNPCPCRSELEPRDGEPSWWATETVHRAVICTPLLTASVTVNAEVPYSEDNYRLHRHGNRYYPTLVDLQLDAGPLSVDCIEDLTGALNRAIEVCREIDDPDTAPCGHWAPCEPDCKGAE